MKRVWGGLVGFCLAGLTAVLPVGMSAVPAQTVTVGYQPINNPWKVAIATGAFQRATGREIVFRLYSSGAKVIEAIANGEVDIAVAGSSPIAAGVSRGLDIKLFWIVEDINAAEALIVRDDGPVRAPADLKGLTIGVPFVSTTHFHALFLLEQAGLTARDVTLRNLQPKQITAAWDARKIDAAFIWDPALAHLKKSGGRVLITSGDLSPRGKATFDGMVVSAPFAETNPDFMIAFVRVMADADEAYRRDPAAWTAGSSQVRTIAELSGANVADVPDTLALYGFPTLAEQASGRWLGGGSEGGAATALRFTAEFLRDQNKIDRLLADYGAAVTPAFVEAALEAVRQ